MLSALSNQFTAFHPTLIETILIYITISYIHYCQSANYAICVLAEC